LTFTYPSHTTKGCVPLSSDVSVFDEIDKDKIITYRKQDYEWQILVDDRKSAQKQYPKALIVPASIDEIMLMYVKGEVE